MLLAGSVNALSALLAIGTLLGYLLVYTPLKRKTPLCILLAAIPGAMPTLIGWGGGIRLDRKECLVAVWHSSSPVSVVPNWPEAGGQSVGCSEIRVSCSRRVSGALFLVRISRSHGGFCQAR